MENVEGQFLPSFLQTSLVHFLKTFYLPPLQISVLVSFKLDRILNNANKKVLQTENTTTSVCVLETLELQLFTLTFNHDLDP